jgi:hypothetical protein
MWKDRATDFLDWQLFDHRSRRLLLIDANRYLMVNDEWILSISGHRYNSHLWHNPSLRDWGRSLLRENGNFLDWH